MIAGLLTVLVDLRLGGSDVLSDPLGYGLVAGGALLAWHRLRGGARLAAGSAALLLATFLGFWGLAQLRAVPPSGIGLTARHAAPQTLMGSALASLGLALALGGLAAALPAGSPAAGHGRRAATANLLLIPMPYISRAIGSDSTGAAGWQLALLLVVVLTVVGYTLFALWQLGRAEPGTHGAGAATAPG